MAMTRERNFYMAKISEQAERFEETRMYMDKVVGSLQAGEELTARERNLLAIAYKNVIGARRSSWRALYSIERVESGIPDNGDKVEAVRTYREKMEAELYDMCKEMLSLVDERLLPSATSAESKVFYLKMKGDYNRYITEFKIGDERSDFADKTLEAYKAAKDIALVELASTNPIWLGLALNFSVFYYEIFNSPEQACSLAKQAFDGATGMIGDPEDEAYREGILILQLLRDNLNMWNSDLEDDVPVIRENREQRPADDDQ